MPNSATCIHCGCEKAAHKIDETQDLFQKLRPGYDKAVSECGGFEGSDPDTDLADIRHQAVLDEQNDLNGRRLGSLLDHYDDL